MTQLVYCLECNTVVGESVGGSQGDLDQVLQVCQACAQHGAQRMSTRLPWMSRWLATPASDAVPR